MQRVSSWQVNTEQPLDKHKNKDAHTQDAPTDVQLKDDEWRCTNVISVNNCLRVMQEETAQLHRRMETVAADEANLEVKIDKKKADLERNQKRLATLRAVRQVFNEQGGMFSAN